MTGIVARVGNMGFARPRGLLGRFGARVMARGNAAEERHLVEVAELGPEDTVLVIGPGPGVGLHAAALRAGRVVGVDPSKLMLATCRKRCAELVQRGVVGLRLGDAEHTGLPDGSVDVVLSVNNVMIWPDWAAGFAELRRVLRSGGRLFVSGHLKWFPGGLPALSSAVDAAGFTDIETWTWEPPGHAAATAGQLRAVRPAD